MEPEASAPSPTAAARPDPSMHARLRSWLVHLRPYAFVVVPLIALWELFAHVVIVRGVPAATDWNAARDFIARERRAGDVVASVPVWTDPLARMHFAGLISLQDAARPDATRYRRALVATIRGSEHPDFNGWGLEREQKFGRITVRVL